MTRERRHKGEGGITRRSDGRWMAFVSLPGGVRKYVYGATEKEVMSKLKATHRVVDSGRPLPDARVTVEQFIETWLIGVAPSLRPGSVRRYKQVLQDHVGPELGKKRLARLAPEDLQVLYAAKLAEGLSPATVRMMHFVFHRALKDAERWGRCARNVADLVDPPRLPRKEAQALTPAQASGVLAAAAGEPLEALFVLAIKTGLRRGELLGLRWRDVDLERGIVRVTGTLQPSGKGMPPAIMEPKSASSARAVVVSPSIVESLRDHRKRQSARRLLAGSEWRDFDFVFTTALGSPVGPMTVGRTWARLLAAVGAESMPSHATRHTAATLMLSAGVSPRVASERLGHSTVAMTLDRYSHVTSGLRNEAAIAVEDTLRQAAAGAPLGVDRLSNRLSSRPGDGVERHQPNTDQR